MELQADILVRSALIAAVIVAPYAVYKWRQVQAVRRERLAAEADGGDGAPPSEPQGPRLEDVIASIDELSRSASEGPTTLLVPAGLTVDGQPVDAATVDALVRDALRRSNLIAVGELDTADGRLLELVARVTMNE